MSPHTKRVLKKHLFVYAMLSVAIIHFAIFYVYVNLDSFLLAFKFQETGAWSLSNFEYFFNNIAMGAQSDVLMCLGNTLIYFGTCLQFIELFVGIFYLQKNSVLAVFSVCIRHTHDCIAS